MRRRVGAAVADCIGFHIGLAVCAALIGSATPALAQTGTAYTYDALGRVKGVTYPDASAVDYNYDAAGNRSIVYVNSIAEPPPAFSVNDVSVTEAGNLVFTVTKSGSTALPYAVSYATANGTATASADYAPTSGTLAFAPGEATKTVTVATIQDAAFETGETVLLNLSSPTNGATLSDSQGAGTINNDDAAPAFAVNDVSVTEGGNLVFTVTKSGTTALSHNVSYATANGSAAAGSDYAAASGTLTFASGETTKTVTVATTQEATYESSETLVLNLSSATSGATISDSQGSGTINNDDSGPAFSVNDVSVIEGGNLVFTVTKTGATELSHAVSYAPADGTAVFGVDYSVPQGGLTFAWNEATKTVSVTTIQESTIETSETMALNLYSATNGATISDSQGIGTIANDDNGSPPNPSYAGNAVCYEDGPDGNGNYWVYWCHQFNITDPDGGTAYFRYNSVDYPNTWSVMYAYTVYNIYVPGYEETYPYGGVPSSVYTWDTTGQNRTYSIACCYTFSPIVLDLDGDGVELVSALTSSITFDMDGDGERERTGWAGADDGLLVLDRDGDGAITTGAEISFVSDLPGARTDLEGLRAFDVNADGLFDSADARFTDFRVWRDANQNGVSEPAELLALADLGIVGLDLAISPTGASAERAVDNVVTGASRFRRADGSEGLVGDAAFLYGAPDVQRDDGRAAVLVGNTVVASRAVSEKAAHGTGAAR